MNVRPMMNDELKKTHRPSRRQTLIFFFLSLAIAAGIICWVFFIDKGNVVVNGEVPLTVNISGNTHQCPDVPCSFSLTPRTYTITLSKQGFFDDVRDVKVQRWGSVELTPSFQFIPTLNEIGETVLPAEEAPLRPPFLGMKKFENFPKNVKRIVFSPSGKTAMLTIGKEIYLYDTETHEVKKTKIPPADEPVWAGEKIAFLELEPAAQGKTERQVLNVWTDDKITQVVSFERPLKKWLIQGSASGVKALVTDQSNENFIYYLIDLNAKTRKRILVNRQPIVTKWAGDYIILMDAPFGRSNTVGRPRLGTASGLSLTSPRLGLEENNLNQNGTKKISGINAETLSEFSLPAIDAENVIEITGSKLIFVSGERQDTGASKLKVSISEAIEEAKNEMTPKEKTPDIFYITEFDILSGKMLTLVNVAPKKEGEYIKRLTASTDGGVLYFEMEEKAFEVILRR